MGKSLPPQADVDLVHSFARLVGDQVEVVLTRPELSLTDGAEVVLRRGKRRLAAAPSDEGSGPTRRLVVRLPRADLDDGVWAVRLRTGDGVVSLGCRLLVQGDRPVVLLWGASDPTSTLPVPHPRGQGPAGSGSPRPQGAARTPRARVRRLARRVSRRVRRSS